jgi:hypothetical protein
MTIFRTPESIHTYLLEICLAKLDRQIAFLAVPPFESAMITIF